MSDSQVSAAGGDDNQIHNDEHSVVTPAVGPRFAPEAGVPSKYFLSLLRVAGSLRCL